MWGYALGLHHEVEDVLERSVETAREAGASGLRPPYLPVWYVVGSSGSGAGGSLVASFSSSAVPDFGSMTAALSTIGSSASSSSSSGSGGGGSFGGGSSGGGGGGAGGGF